MPENNLEHYAASADDTLPDALGGGGDFLESGESPPPGVGEGGGPYGEPDAGDVDGISEAPGSTLAELENPLESAAAIFLEGDEFADLSDEDVHAVAFVEDAIGLEDLDLETAEE